MTEYSWCVRTDCFGAYDSSSLVLRFAPDRPAADAVTSNPARRSGGRTVSLSVRGLICSFPISRPGLPKYFLILVRPKGFEPLTPWFEARRTVRFGFLTITSD
jgi:hypothetical protein